MHIFKRLDNINSEIESNKEGDNLTRINTPSLSRNKVLVVDDNADIALFFKKGLELSGFEVETFVNPKEALSRFKQGYYHLLLIDIRMPEMSGFELYRRIRDKDKKPKVCFITSFLNYYESLKESYPEFGSACLIQKPISIEDLLKHIKRELNYF